jgi:hypothetical protein
MTERVAILGAEWNLLTAGTSADERLVHDALARGAEVLRAVPDARAEPRTPVHRLRAQVVLRAAAASAYRHRLVAERDRLPAARDLERRTYDESIDLDRDLVPPLKLRAKALRAEIRRLEADAVASGLDPSAIEPTVAWAQTLAVDTYEPPRYGSDVDRKAKTLEFFRRLG